MRTIIFRAQPIYEQEIKVKDFVHGDLIQYANGQIGIRQQETGYEMDVNPKTVGQFTGLLDKNGNEIYEGDILQADNGNKGIVIYSNGCFQKETETYPIPIGTDINKVIGNIHDNPEIIK